MIPPDMPPYSWYEVQTQIDQNHREEAQKRRKEALEASRDRRTTPTSIPTSSMSLVQVYSVHLACVRHNESRGDYSIVSSLGYQGAYQLSPTYSAAWAERYGFGDWASTPAHLWPPSVQDQVAANLWHDTNGGAWLNFASYHC